MLLTHRIQNNIDIIELSGKLVMGDTTTEARQKLLEVVKAGDGKLVIKLNKVSFMDSSGLSILVSALKAARGKNGDVVLLGTLMPAVRSLIELTRLHKVFDIFEDETAAIGYLK